MNLQTVTFLVKVGPYHIQCGAQGRCESCPIALALYDTTGEVWAVVQNEASHLESGFDLRLPEKVSGWIKRFDSTAASRIMAENEPIEFEITVPIHIFPAEVQSKFLAKAKLNEAITQDFLRTSLR
jgi:hypothetical protein